MPSVSSKAIIKRIEEDGWFHVRTEGSHHHFRHNSKSGTVTVPHPKKNLPIKTVKSILKQARLGEEKY
jgi:predicted RNA binding protein YcfA (HicA-like mRNA interferase family)